MPSVSSVAFYLLLCIMEVLGIIFFKVLSIISIVIISKYVISKVIVSVERLGFRLMGLGTLE